MKTGLRLARCPACGHEGGIPRSVNGRSRLRCSACGEKFLARYATGDRPCRWRRPSREATAKRAAAQEIVARYAHVCFDDPLNDI